jgi:UDP-N-acetylmuramate dehydrogenase
MYLVLNDISLKKYNSLALDVKAKTLYLPLDYQGLLDVLSLTQDKKRIMIGKGCNILLTKPFYDDSYAFVVTVMDDDLIINDTEMIAATGVNLSRLAWFALEQSLTGYAFLEDIPGTVGGALIMNAGQYEFSFGQQVNWIDLYDTQTNSVKRVTPDDDYFGYRTSQISCHEIVLRAGLKINKGNDEEILTAMLKYKKDRYLKQPRQYPNAGSVFKRPYKEGQSYYVWKLFDETGLRGYRIGDAQVSHKHPGFIVNLGNATPSDMVNLVKECQDRVKKQFDIDLELEWRVID